MKGHWTKRPPPKAQEFRMFFLRMRGSRRTAQANRFVLLAGWKIADQPGETIMAWDAAVKYGWRRWSEPIEEPPR